VHAKRLTPRRELQMIFGKIHGMMKNARQPGDLYKRKSGVKKTRRNMNK